MTVTVERKQKARAKSRSKAARTTLWLIPVISVVLFVIMAVSVCLIHDSEPIPLTDLPATYKGEIKDAEGNLLVPFDVAYPEAFESGEYDYREDALLLKMDKGFNGRITNELKKCGFASIELFADTANGKWYEAKLAEGENVKTAIQRARSLKSVLMADYDYILKSEDAEISGASDGTDISNFPDKVHGNGQLKNQWFLNSAGIQDAWKFLEKNGVDAGGLSSTVVAVIDTGVDYTHPDLAANMWVNKGEIPDNGRDDDGNGYIDDYYGWDAIAGKGSGMDDHGHGTHVAGIIAASNNKEGVVGIAYNAKIMTIKAGQATGIFLQNDIAEAILYAYDMGADVINMSFGGSACSIAVQDALQTAYTRSTLVAAAGNDGLPNEGSDYDPPLPGYPAALSYVIGVMSVNRQGVESGFTNWDTSSFNMVEYEVYAPGEGIYSTLPGGGYGNLSGTSMAAPVVSGMAALLRSYFTDRDMYPSKFIAAQICATSENNSICCDPARHKVGGLVHGVSPFMGVNVAHSTGVMIANVYDALTKLPKPDVNLYNYYIFDGVNLSDKNNGDGVADAGETIDIAIVLRNRWGMSKDTVVKIDSLSSLGMENPYVDILIGEENYDSVGTYSTKSMLVYSEENIITGYTQPLRVKISEDCPNDYRIGLNVTTSYGNGLDDEDKEIYVNEDPYYLGGGISFDVRSGVILPSQIKEDMTLTKENLYIIPNSTYIAKGVTVTVEPGTRIQFWSDDPGDLYADTYIAYLNVEGTFVTQGTEDEPVELFPSDLMAQYRVEIFRTGEGKVDLNYTTVTNPVLDIDTADHCTFRQNYSRYVRYRELSGGKVVMGNSRSVSFIIANTVSNSMIYKCGSASSAQSGAGWTSMPIGGNFEGCAFVDSMINYNNSSMVFAGGALNKYSGRAVTTNCVFMGNYATNEGGSIGVSSTMTEGIYSYPNIHNVIKNPATGSTYVSIYLGSASNYNKYRFDHARSFAKAMGGDLACIEDFAEYRFLKQNDLYGIIGWINGEETMINGSAVPIELYDVVKSSEYCYASCLDSKSNGSWIHFDRSSNIVLIEIPGSIYCDTIILDEYSVEIDMESGYQLSPTVIPATFDVNELIYVSEDPAVAKVSDSGYVTPVSEGETRIFVYSPDYKCSAVLELAVVPKVKLTGISLPESSAVLAVGDELKLMPALSPANTTERELRFDSDNTSAVTVDAMGRVKAVAPGSATVTVTGANGIKATLAIKVVSPVEGLSFTDKFYVTYVGDTNTEWKPTVSPADATDYSVTWLSSNPEVAYVNGSGELVRVAPGSATIRATVEGTKLYADLNITVSDVDEFASSKVVEMDISDNKGWIWAVTDDNALWIWGGKTLRVPIKIADGVKDVIYYGSRYVGYCNIALLKIDGTIELGKVYDDGGRYEPVYEENGYVSVKAVADLTDVVALERNDSSYYALRADGTVWAWGDNDYGQLGDGTTVERSVATQMGVTNVKKVVPYDHSVLLLTNDGKVYLYGTSNRYTEAQLIATNAVDIRRGYEGIVELADGRQLAVQGSGNVDNISAYTGWTYYSSAYEFRIKDETVYWYGKTTVCPDLAEIVYIYFNSIPTLFYYRTTDGKLYGVGENGEYQLADLTITDRDTPVRIFLGLGTSDKAPEVENINLNESKLTENELTVDFDMSLLTGNDYGYIKLTDSNGKVVSLNKNAALDKLTLSPVSGWVHGETYTLTIPANAFICVYGNQNAEIIYTFTYENPTPISQTSSSLEDGAKLKEKSFEASFGFTIANRGENFDDICIKQGELAISGITVTLEKNLLTLSGELDYGDYVISIPAAALCDNVGGTNEAIELAFSIVRTIKLESATVENGALRADERADILLNFTSALAGENYDGITLKTADGENVNITKVLENNALTVKHPALEQGRAYVLTLPAGALTDELGTQSEETVIAFTTYAPASLTHSSLAAGNRSVALLPQIVLIYNGEFDLDADKLTLTDAAGNEVELTATAEGDRIVVTTAALNSGTEYTLTLAEGAMTDERGAKSPAASYTFTTVKQTERFLWDDENVSEKIDEWIEEGYNTPGFTGNAILNDFNDTNVEHWLRITAGNYESGDEYMKSIGLAGNWWGTVNEDIIGKQILDFDDFQSLADINFKNYLTEAPSNTFPFVTAAYLLNSDGERVNRVSNETVTFVVEFNRDMDTTVPLRVRFGSSLPFAEYEIEGEYVTARRWEGTYTLKTTIENGRQYIRVENGRAADDHYLKLMEHVGPTSTRFGFEIDTTGAQAMMMQATATSTGIQLSWVQDDFDTLAGYNVYRSTKEDGQYTKLNSFVIPADVTTFFDDTVEPGMRYYYNFTVVQTDFTESTPSGKINLMSMDTMAPGIYHSPVRVAFTGSNLIVTATVTDNLMVNSVKLYYRAVGDTEWKSANMTNHNDRYSAVIPADVLTTAGLEYYISAYDGLNYTYSGSETAPYAVTVQLAIDASAKGDVNGDGVISNIDALMLLQAANDLLNLTEEQFLRADLNEDGELSAAEALRILQYASGKITTIVG